ncbi:hypothetical protein IHQ75_04350 [Bifidobacterium dentium]|uniref:hypothetical protein n=1 Tax=Bifidobacterium dentium TaxID=1689 RepID=UPI0018C1F74F|nr:hypothetical protein [Bifidobacterium dentium]MBF9710199.1 hypothetical protein [Bifidobacterium dentium]
MVKVNYYNGAADMSSVEFAQAKGFRTNRHGELIVFDNHSQTVATFSSGDWAFVERID